MLEKKNSKEKLQEWLVPTHETRNVHQIQKQFEGIVQMSHSDSQCKAIMKDLTWIKEILKLYGKGRDQNADTRKEKRQKQHMKKEGKSGIAFQINIVLAPTEQ